MTEKDLEALAGCATGCLYVVVSLAFYALAAWGAQYAAWGLFRQPLPYWPLFVGLLVLGFLVKKARAFAPAAKPEGKPPWQT